jgi:hypothetical protein
VPDLQSFGGVVGIACGIVAILLRKRAIGGWLFYFFCQVLLGLALVAATTHWQYYSASEWDTPVRYFLFVISNLSRSVLLALIGAICILLADTRAWHWVITLQYSLAGYALLTVLKLPVDIYCFPSATMRDALSLAFPLVWMVYFAVSARVRRAFPPRNEIQ